MTISKSKTATIELLDQYFTTAFSAPEGIPKLRELILSLAMQGQLVPQNPDDKPARELLKDIEAEKQRLMKEGKLKKSKPLPDITPDEIPYDIPDSWEWARLDDFGLWKSGSTPSRANSSFYGGNISWVKSGEVKQGLISKTDETITLDALQKCSLDLNPIGSVLLAMYGANIGDVGILEIEATTNQAICACQTFSQIDNIFLSKLLISLKKNFILQGAGAAQPNISRIKIINTIVPLPPLEEQKRIVERIESLMDKCDRLEKLQNEREDKRLKIQLAVSDKLLNAPDKPTFDEAWQFIEENFETIYSVKENVKQLRQMILQLAVMGKLVPQETKDRSARELLRDIEAEKQRLIKEGKIKPQKPLPAITPDEIPYNIPDSWQWCRWDNVALKIGDVDHKMPNEINDGIPYISPRDFYGINEINFQNAKKISLDDFNKLSSKILPQKYDIIFPRYGTLGVNRFILTDINFLASYSCAVIKNLNGFIDPKYSYYYSISGLVKNEIKRYTKQTTQANVGVKSIQLFLYPLPPLEEQKRIVEKVDKMMKLCDELEEKITAQTETQTKLLNAIIAQI